MSPLTNRKAALLLASSMILILPIFSRSEYLLHILILTVLSATLAQGWNLIGGYGGQLSLGHAAFYGIGAYSGAVLYGGFASTMSIPSVGLSPWVSLVLSGLLAGLAGLVIGAICFRLKGPYFLISTLALAQVLQVIFLNAREYTNGAVGVLMSSPPNIIIPNLVIIDFSTKIPYYVIGLIMMAFATVIASYFSSSRFGYRLMASRADSDAAEGLGVNVFGLNMVALFVSAFFTGLAGCFYLYYMRFVDPFLVFGIGISVQAVVLTYFGASGTVFGPIVGAFVLVPMLEVLRLMIGIGGPLVYGILLVIIVMALPGGVLRKIKL